MVGSHEVTAILREWRAGNKDAAERLFPLVYEELRRRAAYHLSGERVDHTLQPTALVHEAYLRLVDQASFGAVDRAHFFALASRIIRQVLVDHARTHNAQKRGGSAQRLSLDALEVVPEQTAGDLIDLHEALERLETLDPRKSKVVDMRFFGGLTEAEIAEVLGINEKTVRRDWQFAKVWLYRELSNESSQL